MLKTLQQQVCLLLLLKKKQQTNTSIFINEILLNLVLKLLQ